MGAHDGAVFVLDWFEGAMHLDLLSLLVKALGTTDGFRGFHAATSPGKRIIGNSAPLSSEGGSICLGVFRSACFLLKLKRAQISLRFSTDDVNGTVMEEKIYHGGRSDQAAMHAPAGLARLVRKAGRQLIMRSDDTFTIRGLGPARRQL